MTTSTPSRADWDADCFHWRGRILTGKYAHWCDDWDGLPIDETMPEWPCACAERLIERDRERQARFDDLASNRRC